VATATANELAAPERAQLETMRAHNADLQDFTVTCELLDGAQSPITDGQSSIANGLASVRAQKKEVKKQERQRGEDERIAREALEL
jgi:hypothetical protein